MATLTQDIIICTVSCTGGWQLALLLPWEPDSSSKHGPLPLRRPTAPGTSRAAGFNILEKVLSEPRLRHTLNIYHMNSAQCYLESVFFCAPAVFSLCSKMKWKNRRKCLRLNKKRDTLSSHRYVCLEPAEDVSEGWFTLRNWRNWVRISGVICTLMSVNWVHLWVNTLSWLVFWGLPQITQTWWPKGMNLRKVTLLAPSCQKYSIAFTWHYEVSSSHQHEEYKCTWLHRADLLLCRASRIFPLIDWDSRASSKQVLSFTSAHNISFYFCF